MISKYLVMGLGARHRGLWSCQRVVRCVTVIACFTDQVIILTYK